MKTLLNSIAIAVAAMASVAAPLSAQARGPGGASGWHGGSGYHGGYHGGSWGHRGGYWRGGYWGPGPFWGGLGLGLGIGAIGYYGAYGGYYDSPTYIIQDDPAYIPIAPPVVSSAVVTRSAGQPVPAASRAPDPIFYPKNNQSAAKTDADRQDCNRWATTQSGAMNDASIFQRATFACMEGRGYTVR